MSDTRPEEESDGTCKCSNVINGFTSNLFTTSAVPAHDMTAITLDIEQLLTAQAVKNGMRNAALNQNKMKGSDPFAFQQLRDDLFIFTLLYINSTTSPVFNFHSSHVLTEQERIMIMQ